LLIYIEFGSACDIVIQNWLIIIIVINIIIIITVVLCSASLRLPTQKHSQPRSVITVLRAERKEMEWSTGIY